MRRETKIGLLTLISISVLIFGFKFLQGKNVFSNDIIIYAKYDNVSAILPSNPVYLDGYQVGIVSDVKQNQETLRGYIVGLNINSGIKLPKNTTATINSDLTGGKSVKLEFTGTCSGADCLQDGAMIEGLTEGTLGTLISKDELSGYVQLLKDSIMTMTEGAASDFDVKATMKNLDKVIANFTDVSTTVKNMLASQNSDLNKVLNNTANLTEEATSTIKSLSSSVDSLIQNLNAPEGVLNSTNDRMQEMEGTIAELNKTLGGLNEVIAKINNGDGSLGKLINEKETYDKLNSTLSDLELLLEDFRLHPKRYTRILSKKEIPYEEEGKN